MANNGYFVTKNDKCIFTGEYMEAYVPASFFRKGLNEVLGDKISIMGLFNFRVGKNEESIASSKLETFNFPSMMITKPSSIEESDMVLMESIGSQRYRILKYYKDDEVMTSLQVVQSIANVEKFVNLLIDANLPRTLPYDKLLNLFIRNLEINGQKLPVPAVTLSAIISEIYRYSGDISIPFRKMIGKDKCKITDCIPANARTVCAQNSTYSALTFEDIDTMLVTSINKKRYKKKENKSPLEKIINL